jgi:hypothetical protein
MIKLMIISLKIISIPRVNKFQKVLKIIASKEKHCFSDTTMVIVKNKLLNTEFELEQNSY